MLFCMRVLHPLWTLLYASRLLTNPSLLLSLMVQSEKKLIWHPTRQNSFVVGGGNPIGQIKVYNWDGKSEITEVTALGDLEHMKVCAMGV
jgi:hypothetical protein